MSVRRLFNMFAPRPKRLVIGGTITIGAAGAISAQSGDLLSGGTAVQTASEDGRYTVTFDRTYKRIVGAQVNMVGPADAAFPTTTGSDPQLRLLSASGITLQCKRVDTQADADPASGSVLCWSAIVDLL